MRKWLVGLFAAATVFTVPKLMKNPTDGFFIPKWTSDYARTSVRVLNTAKNSGGSGVILQSARGYGSEILTNKHVCGVVQNGGVVKTQDREVNVASYRLYTKHDLCLIHVSEDLGVSVRLAPKEPQESNDINVSGHPSLLPHIRSRGHLSEKREINVMVDSKKCDGTENPEELVYCMLLGGKPVIKRFDSQLVSALIMPGSSGSGVFNTRGELVGLVFAGSVGDGLSYGSIVPYGFVKDFLENWGDYEPITPDPKGKPHSFFKMIVKSRELCATRNPKFRKLCSFIRFQPIWQQ